MCIVSLCFVLLHLFLQHRMSRGCLWFTLSQIWLPLEAETTILLKMLIEKHRDNCEPDFSYLPVNVCTTIFCCSYSSHSPAVLFSYVNRCAQTYKIHRSTWEWCLPHAMHSTFRCVVAMFTCDQGTTPVIQYSAWSCCVSIYMLSFKPL